MPAPSSTTASLELTPAQASKLSLALNQRDYAAAETLLLDEIDHDPHSLRAARLLSFAGGVYFLNKDYLNAAIAWKKSEALAPLESSAKFSLAMDYIHLGRSQWALPLLESLAAGDPKVALYPYWLGRLDYDAQRYSGAIIYFRQALAIDPEMARAWDNLGLCYFYQNDTTLAIESYEKAIDLDRKSIHPSAWPHLNLAIALQFVNRLEEADSQLREALRLDPNFTQAHYQLGMVLEASNRLDPAVGELLEAARVDPAYAEPHIALARIYRKQGQKDRAQHEVEVYKTLHAKPKSEVNP